MEFLPDPETARSQTEALVRHVAARLGRTVSAIRAVPGGYSAASRMVIEWREGGSVFVKAAVDAETAAWLRTEQAIYTRYQTPFMPAVMGMEDDGETPWMALEDLSAASWPPPWSKARIEAVLATLAEIAANPAADLDSMESRRAEFAGWPRVAAKPQSFLRLGLVTERWLADALPPLLSAERNAELDGGSLLHNDVRSDNLCFAQRGVVMLDWNWACRGNPKLDVAAWLPSLSHEGGPAPESILPGEPELASFVTGFYAAHAGLAPLPSAPHVRALQLAMLRQSLPWASRALGLPAPDGRLA